MQLVHSDAVFKVEPGTQPDYDRGNSMLKLLDLMQRTQLACERETYLTDHLQFLFPFEFLEIYGPAGGDLNILAPEIQDNKTDFQKQNVRNFLTTDTLLIRGWARAGNLTVPFLRVSYRGGPDSKLSKSSNHSLGTDIRLWIKVGANASQNLIVVPYNERSDRYEIELWGFTSDNLRDLLGPRGRDAMGRGELQVRSDLIQGTGSDYNRDGLDEQYMINVAPDNTMHPILPLHLEIAWANDRADIWDSRDGANYQYEFNMILRGWDNYLGVGMSPNPHGGIGFLEYRNLLSNYGRYGGRNELGRQLAPWNFNAHGNKDHVNCTCNQNNTEPYEPFMAVEYMDLHIMKPECGIGLHRHRDNQEVFMMMEGRGYMIIGDWLKMVNRERCFEIRTLRSGHFAMLKGGQVHGLMNPSDEDLSLFMFGGYD